MPRIHLFALLLVVLAATACGGENKANSTSMASPAASQTSGGVTAASPSVSGAAGTRAATRAIAPANPRVILATTTSTVDSGLLDDLLPAFEKATGYTVAALSLGSGQALATAERGEADVLLVHSPDAEKTFMDAGNGLDRRLVMHNDFIIVGPKNDSAQVKGATSAVDAMTRIASAGVPFISRGDNSGTNALELKLWKQASIAPSGKPWYVESGTGMGQTLQITSDRRAYTISDRATYLTQQKILSLDILKQGDPALLNIYHVILVDPKKSDRINATGARAFADWLLSPEGQRLIGEYGKQKYGEQLFFPDAGKDESKLGG